MGNEQLFKDMLKSRRKGMGSANRSRTQHPNANKNVWLYPFQFERRYAKDISKIQRLFTVPLTKVIDENIDRWIEDFKSDTLIKKDKVDRWDTLVQELNMQWYNNYKQGITSDNTSFNDDVFGEELKALIAVEQARLDEIYGGDAPQVRAMITATGIDVSDWNAKQSQKFFKDILGVEFFVPEPWEAEVISAWSETNFGLIKSLSNEYIKGVNTIVSEGLQFGKTSNAIMGEIRKLNKDITGYRARLIARDQVGKLNGALTKRRMADAGIDMYIWMTANDERVRAKHKTLNNKLMRWDDDTVYSDDKGKTWKKRTAKMYRGIPGQDIQCRCTSSPFFDDMIAEVDEEIEQEAA